MNDMNRDRSDLRIDSGELAEAYELGFAAGKRAASAEPTPKPSGEQLGKCEDCGHLIVRHGPEGCDVERGDTLVSGHNSRGEECDSIEMAQGPCGCQTQTVEEVSAQPTALSAERDETESDELARQLDNAEIVISELHAELDRLRATPPTGLRERIEELIAEMKQSAQMSHATSVPTLHWMEKLHAALSAATPERGAPQVRSQKEPQ